MEEDLTLPFKVNDLIELLNKVFPEASPSLTDEPKDMYFKSGQRDVVRFINNLKERADKEALL